MCGNDVEFQSKKLLAKKKRVEENPDYSGGTVVFENKDGVLYRDGKIFDTTRIENLAKNAKIPS